MLSNISNIKIVNNKSTLVIYVSVQHICNLIATYCSKSISDISFILGDVYNYKYSFIATNKTKLLRKVFSLPAKIVNYSNCKAREKSFVWDQVIFCLVTTQIPKINLQSSTKQLFIRISQKLMSMTVFLAFTILIGTIQAMLSFFLRM